MTSYQLRTIWLLVILIVKCTNWVLNAQIGCTQQPILVGTPPRRRAVRHDTNHKLIVPFWKKTGKITDCCKVRFGGKLNSPIKACCLTIPKRRLPPGSAHGEALETTPERSPYVPNRSTSGSFSAISTMPVLPEKLGWQHGEVVGGDRFNRGEGVVCSRNVLPAWLYEPIWYRRYLFDCWSGLSVRQTQSTKNTKRVSITLFFSGVLQRHISQIDPKWPICAALILCFQVWSNMKSRGSLS